MLELIETKHEGPHDEEDVYGRDYLILFEAGTFEDPSTYSSAHVSARIYPEREGVNKLQLNGYWSFPPVKNAFEQMTISQAEPITIEEMETSARGLIATMGLMVKEEVDAVHQRMKQASALRSEG